MRRGVMLADILAWLEKENYDISKSINYDPNVAIYSPSSIDDAGPNNVSFSTKPRDSLASVMFSPVHNDSMLSIASEYPKLDFVKCIKEFFKPGKCKIIKGRNVKIGEFCSIGNEGFGFVQDYDGAWIRFPHHGGIIIGDDVEIGDNVCIDRGSLSDTVIGKGVKIDNLVHIAHNVTIGENSMIVAKSMIAGSVKIGDNCWISPSSNIRNGIKIGNNVMVGMGSNVVKDIPDNVVVAGNPARVIRENNLPWREII